MVTEIVTACERVARQAVAVKEVQYLERDQKIDRALTSRVTGIPVMIALLLGVFWLTIEGANAPSQLLSSALFSLMEPMKAFFARLATSPWLSGLLIDGMYKTLAWVVSVMLPPMAIFFPLFTLLEDLGYLPRVAFCLDDHFRKARAHGKQALTMMMGFGCNACGVTGCRIIDSPRERLIAILTNNFVPCNGRFPTLIALITMFFAGAGGLLGSLASTLLLTGVIVLGVLMTLLVSRLLSATVLKGIPSSFQLELPPYRRPQIGKVIVRSVLDRTVFVLGRAVAVAAPAGLLIWLMANIPVGGGSALGACAGFFDPLGRLMGLDGTILMAFLLGFPANEVVIPILIMSYLQAGSLTGLESLGALRALFVAHGWTWLTAVCTMLFSLMHWPCGTTCWTIRKETQSWKWTAVSFLVPTVSGITICFIVASAARLLGLV
jgi:ferrous iron transport protein B